MAASSIVTVQQQRSVRQKGLDAIARTAPRGRGLAPVIALPLRDAAGRTRPDVDLLPAPEPEPAARLTVVPAPSRGRRRPALTVAVVLCVAALLLLFGGRVAGSSVEPTAAGHVVLQPGETLWDIAVRSAPAGVDPRRQLATLRQLNGFGPGALDAWTVVLIPAR